MKKTLPLIGIFLTSLPILYQLSLGITNVTTDGWAHLFRQVAFDEALRDGQFPPSWAGRAVFGFGSPVFLFNWTLPYYFVELLLIAGVPLLTASNIFYTICLLGGAIIMYFFLERFFGRPAAVLGAVCYLYSPYRLLNVFLYGAWGEILALFIGPILLFWVVNLFNKQTRVMFFFGGMITALLILSHNVLSIMFIAMAGSLIVLMVLGGVLTKQSRSKLGRFGLLGVLGLVFGVLLTVYFWLPAVLEKNLIYASNLAVRGIRDMNYKTIWGMLTVGWENLLQKRPFYTSFTVGLPILTAAILTVVKSLPPLLCFRGVGGLLRSLKAFRVKEAIIFWAVFWFVVSLFMAMPESEWIWARLPMLPMFLYPYRFIAGMTVSGVVLAGYVFNKLAKLDRLGFLGRLGILGCLIITVLAGLPYLNPLIDHGKIPSSYFYSDQPPYWAPGNWVSMGNEDFLPKWVPREFLWGMQKEGKPKEMYNVQFTPLRPSTPLGVSEGQANFKKISESKSSNRAEMRFVAEGDGVVTVNIFYFPGWRVFDNGKEVLTVGYDNNGKIKFPISAGEHWIKMEFVDTSVHTYSKIFSMVMMIGFLGLGLWGKRLKLFTA